MPISKEELEQWNAEADRKIMLEQIEGNMSEEEFAQQERAKWRWSGSHARGMWITAADLAADMNTGVTSLLGPQVQDILASIGWGRFSDELPRMGITGAGAEAAGTAMTLAAGLGKAITTKTVQAGSKLLMGEGAEASLLSRVSADLAGAVQKHPKIFLGSEVGGGFGAGTAGAAAAQEGVDPNLQAIASLTGGLTGGVAPLYGANITRQAMNWAGQTVTPLFTGGETLAAVRLQALSANPRAAARKALNAPEGVSPARATEDQNLMALEARILEDNPEAAAAFAESLTNARQIAQQQLRDFEGNLRAPGEWERSVIEKVAAPGAAITIDEPQAMLKQARKSFSSVYDDFSGFPMKLHVEGDMGEVPLDQVFKLAVTDETILASDSERKIAAKILQDEFSRIKPSADKDPTVNSEKLLFVRQRLRDKISDLTASRKRASHITARILSNGEAAITNLFNQQLPGEALTSLKQIDGQYNTYRIVEQAVLTAGDRKMSADVLGSAIRSLSPTGAQDLRKAARAGRNIDSVLNDPRAAALMVKRQKPLVKKQIQSDFFHSAWERSVTKDLGDGDAPLISGERYLQHLIAHKATAKALGIPQEELNRAMEIARTIKVMEAKSPAALRAVIESGPATILQLLTTLVGAKSGQRLAGAGMGSSLVMSQFGSERARRLLALRFRDGATETLIEATKNKELYAALLTKSTASHSEQERAARTIAMWTETSVQHALEGEED